MGINRKAINFDLSTKSLEKYFKDTREPYSLIKKFMLENGFEHRQYSGYTSKEPIDERRVIRIVNKLTKKFTWLGECVKEFDITEIGEQYSLKETIQDLCTKDFHQKLKEFIEKTPKNQKLKDLER
ncbi:TPA: vapd [Campylobacter coli]|uniref:virulence-associated protein VapD n=1 Tax=Campylobacter coli TaxID=195 RepID=UPI00295DE75B|nr:vapd [Campylobacter coli]MCE7310362.1 vapd [Campylobacter coli]HEE9546508.1 vapd [Campylobacter coli]HEF3118372.1 vapd [Campylobacter coli]HEG0331890.1 vapd [Campylobacter coli]